MQDQAVSASAERGLQIQIKRLTSLREQIIGMRGDVATMRDYLVGGGTATDKEERLAEAVPSGTLGSVVAAIDGLEEAVNDLNHEIGELVSNNRI